MALTSCCLARMYYVNPSAYSPQSAGLFSYHANKKVHTLDSTKKLVIVALSGLAAFETNWLVYKFTASLLLSGSIALVAAVVTLVAISHFMKTFVKWKIEGDLREARTEQAALNAIARGAEGIEPGLPKRSPALLNACRHRFPNVVEHILNKDKGLIHTWSNATGTCLHAIINSEVQQAGKIEAEKLAFLKSFLAHCDDVQVREQLINEPYYKDGTLTAFEAAVDNDLSDIAEWLTENANVFNCDQPKAVCTTLLNKQPVLSKLLEIEHFRKTLGEFLESQSSRGSTQRLLSKMHRKNDDLPEDVSASATKAIKVGDRNYAEIEAQLKDNLLAIKLVYFANLCMQAEEHNRESYIVNFISASKEQPILSKENIEAARPHLPKLFINYLPAEDEQLD